MDCYSNACMLARNMKFGSLTAHIKCIYMCKHTFTHIHTSINNFAFLHIRFRCLCMPWYLNGALWLLYAYLSSKSLKFHFSKRILFTIFVALKNFRWMFTWHDTGIRKLSKWDESYTITSHSNISLKKITCSKKTTTTKKHYLHGKVDNFIWTSSICSWPFSHSSISVIIVSIASIFIFIFVNANERSTAQIINLLELLCMMKHAETSHFNRKQETEENIVYWVQVHEAATVYSCVQQNLIQMKMIYLSQTFVYVLIIFNQIFLKLQKLFYAADVKLLTMPMRNLDRAMNRSLWNRLSCLNKSHLLDKLSKIQNKTWKTSISVILCLV